MHEESKRQALAGLVAELSGFLPSFDEADAAAFEGAFRTALQSVGDVEIPRRAPSVEGGGGESVPPVDALISELLSGAPYAAVGRCVRAIVEDAAGLVWEMQRAVLGSLRRHHAGSVEGLRSAVAVEGDRWREVIRESASAIEATTLTVIADSMRIVLYEWIHQHPDESHSSLARASSRLLAPPAFPVSRVASLALKNAASSLDDLLSKARGGMAEIFGSTGGEESEGARDEARVDATRQLLVEVMSYEATLKAAIAPYVEGRSLP